MIKHFYSYHVETDSLILDINSLEIEEHEKKHLISLAEAQIHHAVLDAIMSVLPKEDKKQFLTHLNTKDHTKIWNFLHEKVEDVEKRIKEAAHVVKKELHRDIREAKSEKKEDARG